MKLWEMLLPTDEGEVLTNGSDANVKKIIDQTQLRKTTENFETYGVMLFFLITVYASESTIPRKAKTFVKVHLTV